MKLIPEVKKLNSTEKAFKAPKEWIVGFENLDYDFKDAFQQVFPFPYDTGFDANLNFRDNESLKEEGYRLCLKDSAVTIEYKTEAGALYALYSLVQLLACTEVKELEIIDYPDVKVRGVMLDISRNKIPKVEEIKILIQKLSFLRINHFELYIEGFSFYDESYPLGDFRDSYTLDDFLEIQDYAKKYMVDLVPNMNGFGHMTSWLSLPEIHPLAEKEDGYLNHGFPFPPSTLDPSNPKSLELVKRLYKPLIENSFSPNFHMDLDEPFELGEGKSKELVEKLGKVKVYMTYVNQLKEFVKSYHKKPWLWGDVLFSHPSELKDLPKDLVYCDWGYDFDYPFEEHSAWLEKERLSFVLCPGTSSWNSFTSRFNDMQKTTQNAIDSVIKHHGLGVLTTDWGDFGHLQPIVFSYLGFVYMGLHSWNQNSQFDLEEAVDDVFFEGRSLAKYLKECSLTSTYENMYTYNGSMTFESLMFTDPDITHPVQFRYGILRQVFSQKPLTKEAKEKVVIHLESILNELNEEDHTLLEVREIKLMVKLSIWMVNIRYAFSFEEKLPKEMLSEIDELIDESSFVWLERNRHSYLELSLSRLVSLKQILTYYFEEVMI